MDAQRGDTFPARRCWPPLGKGPAARVIAVNAALLATSKMSSKRCPHLILRFAAQPGFHPASISAEISAGGAWLLCSWPPGKAMAALSSRNSRRWRSSWPESISESSDIDSSRLAAAAIRVATADSVGIFGWCSSREPPGFEESDKAVCRNTGTTARPAPPGRTGNDQFSVGKLIDMRAGNVQGAADVFR